VRGGGRGLSNVQSAILLVVIVLAAGAASYSFLLRQSTSSYGAAQAIIASGERQLQEKLVLAHWYAGTAWIYNYGEVQVNASMVYVDGVAARSNVVLGKGMNRVSLPVGNELVIVTDKGGMIKLAAETALPKP